MAEDKEGSAPEEQSGGSPSKPMSKLEQARAAARQAAQQSEETSEAPEQSPSKPMSKLEQARAASKEKSAEKTGGEEDEASKPKSKLEQLRAAAAGKGAGPSDTKSKLAAARAAGGAKAEKPAAQGSTAGAKAPPPPMPKRPATSAKAKAGSGDDRRSFLFGLFGIGAILVTAWVAFSAACAVALAGTVRFMFPNVLTEPPSKFKIGSPGDYPPDSVSTKWKAQFGIWVVNTTYNGQQEVYALRTVCTHLGCTPNWLDAERKFKCPCHGSGFYISGINFEGPAPRPLERYAIHLAEDGQLEVDKSQMFQQELGQWEDTASYVIV